MIRPSLAGRRACEGVATSVPSGRYIVGRGTDGCARTPITVGFPDDAEAADGDRVRDASWLGGGHGERLVARVRSQAGDAERFNAKAQGRRGAKKTKFSVFLRLRSLASLRLFLSSPRGRFLAGLLTGDTSRTTQSSTTRSTQRREGVSSTSILPWRSNRGETCKTPPSPPPQSGPRRGIEPGSRCSPPIPGCPVLRDPRLAARPCSPCKHRTTRYMRLPWTSRFACWAPAVSDRSLA
jgi:hypothetical protein